MTGASRERIDEVTETIHKKASLRAPVYSPRVEDVDLNRFMRLIKFVAIGGLVGVGISLVVGAPLAMKLAEMHTVVSSAFLMIPVATAGFLLGATAGAFIEDRTWPRLSQSRTG